MSMTENEAIRDLDIIRFNPHWDELVNEEYWEELMTMAIQALEENQQYRAIGTVEELKSLKESNLTALEMADLWCVLEDLKRYSAIGTIDEFKALKEADMRGANRAVDEFANYLHKIAKENNGLRLSSETRSWTHPCIFDYLKEFKEKQIFEEET